MTRSCRTRRGLRRGLAGAALVAAVTTSATGCGTPQAGAAAVVGDERITVDAVQSATSEINDVLGGDSRIPQTVILSWLLMSDVVLEEAAERGTVASEQDAEKLLSDSANQAQGGAEGASPSPSSPAPVDLGPSALLALRSYMSASQAAQELQEEAAIKEWWAGVLDRIEEQGIKINPRFGSYTRPDVQNATSLDQLMTLVGNDTPNWLQSPAPSADPNAGGEGTPQEGAPEDGGAPQEGAPEDGGAPQEGAPEDGSAPEQP